MMLFLSQSIICMHLSVVHVSIFYDFKSYDSSLFRHTHRSVYFPTDFHLSLLLSTQAGSQPFTSVSWLPTLRLLVTITKDGALQVWKTRVIINPNRQPMETHFFERAGQFLFFPSFDEIEKFLSYFFFRSQAAFCSLQLHGLVTYVFFLRMIFCNHFLC